MVTAMNAINHELVKELRTRLGVLLGQREMLEVARDRDGINDQIKRLDDDVAVLCRDIYNAEHGLRA